MSAMRTVCEIPSVVSGPAVPCGVRRVPAIPREEFRKLEHALSIIESQSKIARQELARLQTFEKTGQTA